MRRKDREVTDINGIVEILSECEVIRLGVIHGEEPYIVPLNFAFEVRDDSLLLYVHSAAVGRKIDAISSNPRVCFEADRLIEIVEDASDACEWSARYESVIGYGRAEILVDAGEKTAALELLVRRCGFVGEFRAGEEMLRRTAVIRVTVESVVGKANK